MAPTRDARSRIENRRRGKQLGSARMSRTQDDLDEDPPESRSSDNRGQGRDLRNRLGRRKDEVTTTTSWKSYSDASESEKDDFNDSPHSYERLTIEVQQD